MVSNSTTRSHPDRIGPYRIERLLGSGGMGEVFLASREDDFEQRVALKVVGNPASSEEILSRFYNERQILANLEHPGIARLLDGGATEEGQPWFAMEFVEGQRLDRYCEEHGLSLRDRLELFCKVCEAVQFAHQNLVVHRDLKAANILVAPDGTPRLLDFGIAKVLGSERLASPGVTRPGQVPMTPSYASPEQILNQSLTTACDVYALGVLLFRLLTGRAPYRLEGLTYAEMVDVVCYQEPEKPSVAVDWEEEPWADDRPTIVTETQEGPVSEGQAGSAVASGETSRRRLRRQLTGDLDAIVVKALRKDPRDRYGSAAELAEDIRRHLSGLPVRARQGTWLYLGRKFVWRHKVLLAVLFLILSFGLITTVLWQRAVEERAQAVRESTRAVRVTKTLESLLSAANPDEAQGVDLTAEELLAQGREGIAAWLEKEPEVAAEVLGTLGEVYNNRGLFKEAAELKREALRARKLETPGDSPGLAKDINNLARLYYDLGDYERAEEMFREAIAIRRRLGEGGGELATNLTNLASTLSRRGLYEEAGGLLEEALRIYREEAGPESLEVAAGLYSLGVLQFNHGDYESAQALLNTALKLRKELSGPRHTGVGQILNSLGQVAHASGDLGASVAYYEEALDLRRELLGDDHISVASTQKRMADVLLDRGEVESAKALIEQALTTLRSTVPAENIAIIDAERVLGRILLVQGSYGEAEAYLVPSYQRLAEVRGGASPATQSALRSLIALYEAWGRPAAAAEYRAKAPATLAAAGSG